MKNIEKELKYQLTKADFYKFKNFLDNNEVNRVSTFTQINYYFDTEELSLKDRDTTIRIRKIIEPLKKYELTLKTPLRKSNNSNIKIKNEFSLDLDEQIAECIITKGNFKNYYFLLNKILNEVKEEICPDKITLIGNLKTIREIYLLDYNYDPINIDISSYLGEEDYEIEWETDKVYEAANILVKILNKLEITVSNNTLSKNTRFINKYLEIKNERY
jgi:uncharacterized protein YjbK